jgi:hypothetical protein
LALALLLIGPLCLWYDFDFGQSDRRGCCCIGCWASGNNSVVECDLAKVEVAGSNPVSRSNLLKAKVARHSEAATSGVTVPLERFG